MTEENMNGNLFSGKDHSEMDLDIRTEINFARKDHPEGRMVPVSVDGKEEFILIPLDIKNGDTIKVDGRGKYHSRSGKTGDLYVLVHIKETVWPWKTILLSGVLILALIAVLLLLTGKNAPSKPTEPVCSHEWIPATCITPKICKTCNKTEGTEANHQWQDATCVAPKTCKTCGKTEGDAVGHQWQDATCVAPKTCKSCGKAEGDAVGHQWQDATCTGPKICKVCGETEGAKADHQWIDATYYSPRTCAICQEIEGDVLLNPMVGSIRERLPIVTYAMSSAQKIFGYEDPELTQKSNEYYFVPYKDEIVITNISGNGSALEIRYPSSISSSGYRTLWFSTEEIVPLQEIEVSYEVANEEITTYRFSKDNDALKQYGRMDPGNEYIVLGITESGYKVIEYSIYRDTICDLDVRDKIALIK